MCKILWLDNDAASLQPYADYLEKYELFVTLISDPSQALDMLRGSDHHFECLLLDVRFYKISELPSDPNAIQSGFDFLDKMIEHGVSTPVCILSSYLRVKEHEERLEDYRKNESLRGIALDKFVGDTNSPVFESTFVNKLREFVESVESHNMQLGIARTDMLSQIPSDPFSMRFHTYSGLSKVEQAKIRDAAREVVDANLEKIAADEGVIWALYLGDSKEPFRTATSFDEIAETDEIRALALDRNRIPFQFRMNSVVEDNWGGCGGKVEHASYPKIALQTRGASDKESDWNVHFDTGSFETFFSLEEFMEIGLYSDFPDWTDGKHRGKRFTYRREKVHFKIQDEKTTETLTVTAWVNLVESWSGSPFIAPCFKGCKTGQKFFIGSVRNCVNRPGLIGRSFLLSNNLKAVYIPDEPMLKISRK